MLTFLVGKNSLTAVPNSLVKRSYLSQTRLHLAHHPKTAEQFTDRMPASTGAKITFFNALFSVDTRIGGLALRE